MKKLVSMMLALIMILSLCGAMAENGFTVQNVKYDTATLGKAGVPKGYQLFTSVNCCDDETCLGFPIRVAVGEVDTDNAVMMLYYRGENYIHRKSHSYFSHVENSLDQEFAMFMKEYMPAYNYCWYRAGEILKGLGVDAQLQGYQDDLTSFRKAAAAREDYVWDKIVPGLNGSGLNVDWVEGTAAERVFTFENNGITWCISVYAEDIAYQYSTNLFNTTSVIWEVPYYFALVCPKDIYQEVHDTDYRIFRENTGTNDEFDDFGKVLNDKISADVIRNWNMRVAASMAYMETMTALTFSMVEGTLGGTYHNTDRFSDYIFDQNDYTTLNGDHVKVSTSYDYVYQSGNDIFFTNDALSIPTNATMLTPNY